jgi:hypothetical protein
MKKDIFNGNIKEKYISYVKFSLAFAASLFFAFSVFFLLFALLYEKIEYHARIMMFVFSGLCFLASFLYPTVSIYAIRNYSKHSKLAKSMVKPFVFQDFEVDLLRYIVERDIENKSKK